ncbi:MAG: zinc metallopeptidase [Bacteroidetes bacterium]|nr:MAG: zinc metallopeptidase [Bacteroidota bacterium]TNE96745.1 MAG: zinc metallopeptidase [Bacteroidota bacterium]
MGFGFGPVMIIGFLFMGLGMLVSSVLRSRFARYSQQPSQLGMTGKEIAERMLSDHGIYDVQVTCVQGELTDHYNPMNKTVNLSEQVYHGANAAAAAVAAHECGHAVQHAKAYAPLNFRSKLVPLQNISGTIINMIMMVSFIGGSVLFETFPTTLVASVVIGAYGTLALFSLVTLPVEFDASKRALQWIESSGISTSQEYDQSKDALKWAAMTYVVAALGALVTLLYFILSFVGGSED